MTVQSRGEKKIADWLVAHKISYLYDERYRIAGDAVIRPDFYLPEFDLYIEYWGMDMPEYLENKRYKQFLYQRAAERLFQNFMRTPMPPWVQSLWAHS